MLAPAAAAVETWRWTSELRAAATQSTWRATAGWRGGGGEATRWRVRGRGLLGAEEVAVVERAFFWGAEGGVGFADADEALGSGRVVGMEIGVVGFGEGVEFSRRGGGC